MEAWDLGKLAAHRGVNKRFVVSTSHSLSPFHIVFKLIETQLKI